MSSQVIFTLPSELNLMTVNTEQRFELGYGMFLFARAAITKYHRLGGLNNRNLCSDASGDCKSKIKVSTNLVSSEASLLGLQMACFLLFFAWSFLCAGIPGVCLCVKISYACENNSQIGLQSTIMTSF